MIECFQAKALRETQRGSYALCDWENMDQAPFSFVLDIKNDIKRAD